MDSQQNYLDRLQHMLNFYQHMNEILNILDHDLQQQTESINSNANPNTSNNSEVNSQVQSQQQQQSSSISEALEHETQQQTSNQQSENQSNSHDIMIQQLLENIISSQENQSQQQQQSQQANNESQNVENIQQQSPQINEESQNSTSSIHENITENSNVNNETSTTTTSTSSNNTHNITVGFFVDRIMISNRLMFFSIRIRHLPEFNFSSSNEPVSKEVLDQIPILEINENNLHEFNDEQCAICYENFKITENVLKTHCKHQFHQNCIKIWFESRNTCPVCRQKIQKQQENENNNVDVQSNDLNNVD